MERVGRQEDLEAGAAELGYTPYQILIIASMIEREAKLPEDRPKIARVIYNRLGPFSPYPQLQIDATLLYNQDPALSIGELRQIDSPYNTYLHTGSAADADRQPRPGVDPRRAAPRAEPAVGRPGLPGAARPDQLPDLLLRARQRGRRSCVRGDPRTARAQRRRRPRRRPAGLTGDRMTAPTGTTQLTAVIGSPVRHSLSPTLHNAAFAAAELDWVMLAFEVAPRIRRGRRRARCARSVCAAWRSRCRTRPTSRRRSTWSIRPPPALGSVNTVVLRDDGSTFGTSTDGEGFVASLLAQGIDPAGARVALLGAGAAARAVIDALGGPASPTWRS